MSAKISIHVVTILVGLFGAAFGAAFGASVARAQDGAAGEPQPPAEFFERVEVDIVNVDVYVTDKKGNPVRGLTADDFRIFEEGQEQQVTNFFAAPGVREFEEVPSLEALTEGSPAPRGDRRILDPAQQLHLVVFVDNLNIRPSQRNQVLEAVKKDLFEDLDRNTQVTLVAYDGQMEMRTLPTSDRREVQRELEDVIRGSAGGEIDLLLRASILRELERVGTGGELYNRRAAEELDTVLSDIYSYSQQANDRVRATVGTLSQLVTILAGLEGRKALVYISQGLSLHPGDTMFRAYERKASRVPLAPQINAESEGRSFDNTEYFETLGKQANAGRVTFYTVMAGGRGSVTLTPAETPAFVDLDDTINLGRVWDDGLQTIEYSHHRGSLDILAQSTGGRATVSSSDFGSAIDDLKQDMSSYYSLGYRSQLFGGRRGEDRRIRVQVRDGDWQVRHRESYRSLEPDEKMAAVTRSSLMLQSANDALGIRVDFGEPQRQEKALGADRWLVPILVKFPIARLTLIPGASAHQGQVTIYVATQGPDGNQSPVQKLEAPVRIPNDKMQMALSQVAGYRMTLEMREGKHQIAVTVRDEVADTGSTTLHSYRPESAGSGAARNGVP